jgi:hypothetical protein
MLTCYFTELKTNNRQKKSIGILPETLYTNNSKKTNARCSMNTTASKAFLQYQENHN